MKQLAGTILFILFLTTCIAQQQSFKEINTIRGDIVDFQIDNLGNVFIISSNNQLKKINHAGDSVGVFNDVRQYGKISAVDATNPLKVLLFYKDFANIVVLDRFLNVRNTINLRRLNILQARTITQSYDNGIWTYDEQDARLKRLSDDGTIVDQSADFRLLLEAAPSPVSIIDQNRLVYLYDPEKGLFIFDYFGTLKNKVALLGWEDFQVLDGKVFGRKQTTIQQYEPGTLTMKEQNLPLMLSGVTKLKISGKNLYCLKDGTIKVYAF
ncbi:MAG: hypothetical protein WKF89_04930 [Chitinophagaceae bacterium]